jgi:hypothetical protein
MASGVREAIIKAMVDIARAHPDVTTLLDIKPIPDRTRPAASNPSEVRDGV